MDQEKKEKKTQQKTKPIEKREYFCAVNKRPVKKPRTLTFF